MKINCVIVLLATMYSSSAYAQGIDFQLAKMESGKPFCAVFFNITNNTGLNITSGLVEMTLREKDDSIISKETLLFERIKKGETEAARSLVAGGNCSPIKTIRLQLAIVGIDGNLTDSNRVLSKVDSGKRSSRVPGVFVK
jgi:hypothetical protein